MRILLFGSQGQLGSELRSSLAALGEVIAPTRASGDLCGDLAQIDQLVQTVERTRCDAVVNAAAYTAVDRAESEPDLARRVNALAPGALAQACARAGALLVHYSTDYVFDGSGNTPWRETDATGPLNVYGQTKLEGEQLVQASGVPHLILRTSWVYGRHGQNFARTMLRLAGERDDLRVVDDQFGAPTSARWLAEVSVLAMRQVLAGQAEGGLFHVCPGGETSWHGYATWLIELARHKGVPIKVRPEAVLPVPSSAYPSAARRPANSRLDGSLFGKRFGVPRPHWHAGLEQFLQDSLAASVK